MASLSKCSIKYLALVLVATNFKITVLSVLTSYIIYMIFLQHKTFLILFLSCQISALLHYKINCYYFLAI